MKVLAGMLVVTGLWAAACSSAGSTNPYATFGTTVNDAIPDGLKLGGLSEDASLSALKDLSGACAVDYTDCPYLATTGGTDAVAGEILMRLWGLDYDNECTDALIADGTCFTCAECNPDSPTITNFIMPTILAGPATCATTGFDAGRYVNFNVDPCFFDSMLNDITNTDECETVAGGSVDITGTVPWFASWNIPSTVNFSSFSVRDGGGIWWTVNHGTAGNEQYFLSLDADWIYAGLKDFDDDRFLFFGTGSPAYFADEATAGGFTTGVNIAAYAGTLSAIPAQFETIQIRNQDPHNYIERMKSNGTYLWYQSWTDNDFPDTPAEAETVKDDPTMNRCVAIGASVVTSRYVPLITCVTDFGKASVEELNQDTNFILRIVDAETASAIDFSTPLTSTTDSSCLEEETPMVE